MDERGKPTFVCLVGLPASGKTTYAYDIAYDMNAVVIDSDEYRKNLFGNEEDQNNNQKLFQVMHKTIKDCLRACKNVVFSATNLSSKRRRALLNELIKIPCEKKCIIMATPFEQCLENNRNRERQVPKDAMWRMYKSWQTPAMFEGFDSIETRYWKGSRRSIDAVDYINSLMDFDQDNPHHTLTLGRHMIRAYELASGNPNNDIDVIYAASLHDIGKVRCKTYVNYKGRECEHAHFYMHENCGAYDVLFFDFYVDQTDELTLAVSLLINLHMSLYHFDKSPNPYKLHDKYRKLWGAELYNKIEVLHEADVNAH